MKLERVANRVGSFLMENASIECWGLKRPFRFWIRTCSFGEIQTSQNRKVKATCVVTEAIIVVGHHPEMMLLCSRRLFMWGKQWEAIRVNRSGCVIITPHPRTRDGAAVQVWTKWSGRFKKLSWILIMSFPTILRAWTHRRLRQLPVIKYYQR